MRFNESTPRSSTTAASPTGSCTTRSSSRSRTPTACALPPVIGAATAGVGPGLHGLASGVVNTSRMVGGALGLAVLATAAASRTAEVLAGAPPGPDALVAGFHVAYLAAAGTMVLSAALAWLLPRPQHRGLTDRAAPIRAAVARTRTLPIPPPARSRITRVPGPGTGRPRMRAAGDPGRHLRAL